MITHHIAPYVAPVETYQQRMKRFNGEFGGDSHKLFIFERTKRACKFAVGEHVYFKRNKYQIINIDDELNQVIWDGLTACIITIWNGGEKDDDMLCVHPNQLKRKR